MKLDGEDYRRICEREHSVFFKNNDIDLEKVRDWHEIKKRALRWRIECESALFAGLGRKDFHLIIYEEMVSNPFQVAQRLFDWLNWEMQ